MPRTFTASTAAASSTEVAVPPAEPAVELMPGPKSDGQIADIAEQINKLERETNLGFHLRVGEIIVEGLYDDGLEGWRARGDGDSSFRRLAEREELGMSKSVLHRAVQAFELWTRLGKPTWNYLGISHLRAVLALPEDKQEGMLAKAEKGNWTAREIEKKAKDGKAKDGRGRPALPGYLKAVRQLRRIAADEESMLGDLDTIDALDEDGAADLQKELEAVKGAVAKIEERLAGRTKPV